MEPIRPSQGAIKVKILFFGPLAELMNQKVIELSLVYGTTINQLVERFEMTQFLSQGILIALNGEVVTDLDEFLQDASEIAFLPPVSGG
jgi:molybdopterin converting factor small subunit|tara:strand:+ start:2562 stop:2828 length:267 start_codon:yes stop_codon:yes gene_type:complete